MKIFWPKLVSNIPYQSLCRTCHYFTISVSDGTEIIVVHWYFVENFEMKDDEITLKGFLDLNLMEAQDADGDPNDLWVTLESMGYNQALELDQVWCC